MDNVRFVVNRPSVIHETVDDETIIVNLETGCYYDMNHVASYIFDLLAEGATGEQLARSLASRHEVDADTARRAVETLLDELLEEQLIVAATNAGGSVSASTDRAPAPEAQPFAMPQLNRHTDMQELLLLDPIHDAPPEMLPDVQW